MNVTEALSARYTCRAFKQETVSQETLASIFEAALHSPSWANTQPWELFVATGETLERIRSAYLEKYRKGVSRSLDIAAPGVWPAALKQRIEEMAAKRFEVMGIDPGDTAARQALGEQNFRLFGAPAVVYLCMDRTLSQWGLFDMGSLAQSIMLAAQQHGLDSAPAVMLVAFPDILRAELGVPADLAFVVGIALGHGDHEHIQNRYRSTRRTVEDVVRFRE